MDDKPTLDRGLIPPIIFGVFSVFGICLVLLLARLSTFRAVTEAEETSTPFQYLFLGTEPGISTTTPEDEPTVRGTTTPVSFASPTRRIATTQSGDDVTSLASPTRTRTPSSSGTSTSSSGSAAPLNPGTYDQADQRITYAGNWIAQTGVSGVFQNTLHVSNTLSNTASFRFIGEQIRIFYQSGSGLGTIRINLDGLEYDLDESADVVTQSEWISPLLINGTHTVTITHLSGGSINLDMIIVPDILATATTTPTP